MIKNQYGEWPDTHKDRFQDPAFQKRMLEIARSPERREKISRALKGRPKTPETRRAISIAQQILHSDPTRHAQFHERASASHKGHLNPMKGKHYGEEVRAKVRAGMKDLFEDPIRYAEYLKKMRDGRLRSDPRYNIYISRQYSRSQQRTIRQAIKLIYEINYSSFQVGDSNPAKRMDVRVKISKALKGRPRPDMRYPKSSETCRRMRNYALNRPLEHSQRLYERIRRGDQHPLWKGGPKKYCIKFNKQFKRECRASWGNVCIICGIGRGKKDLPVHHIHYDGQAGCNGISLECIPVCAIHHAATNHYRQWWIAYFENRLWNIFGWHTDLVPEET